METWLDKVGGVSLSRICLLGFQVVQQPQLQGQGGRVLLGYHPFHQEYYPAVHWVHFLHFRLPSHAFISGWRGKTRIAILMVYCPPCCPIAFLPKLWGDFEHGAGMPLSVGLRAFNIHAKASGKAVAHHGDIMTAICTLDLACRQDYGEPCLRSKGR